MFFESIQQMKKMLGHMDQWLASAAAHAEAKAFDPNVYLTARLAPDQFPLGKQVQIACDTVKLGAARLAGKEAPSHPDTETTVGELQARIRSTVAFLDGLTAADFADASTRAISQPRWEGKTMTGTDFLREYLTPNFYFHTTHVYALLRHGGVGLGKRDYLGTLTMKLP